MSHLLPKNQIITVSNLKPKFCKQFKTTTKWNECSKSLNEHIMSGNRKNVLMLHEIWYNFSFGLSSNFSMGQKLVYISHFSTLFSDEWTSFKREMVFKDEKDWVHYISCMCFCFYCDCNCDCDWKCFIIALFTDLFRPNTMDFHSCYLLLVFFFSSSSSFFIKSSL